VPPEKTTAHGSLPAIDVVQTDVQPGHEEADETPEHVIRGVDDGADGLDVIKTGPIREQKGHRAKHGSQNDLEDELDPSNDRHDKNIITYKDFNLILTPLSPLFSYP
jgi:hypothetical protein